MRNLAMTILGLYKKLLSPFLPPACRFQPTCSEYAREAIEVHGLGRGGMLTVKRLCRCHPLGGSGWDPVPGPSHSPYDKTTKRVMTDG